MRLLFRVDASLQIGGGHVMRCLTLAKAATKRGHEVVFISRVLEGHLHDLIQEDFALSPLSAPKGAYHQADQDPAHAHWLECPWQQDAKETKAIHNALAPDWLVLDHYGLDARWIDAVSPQKTLVLDDLADRPLRADILLDQTRLSPIKYATSVRRHLSGPGYALLREEFAQAPKARAQHDTPRILIAPGLMDSYGLAKLALDALSDLDVAFDVATGPNAHDLSNLVDKDLPNVTIHAPADNMAKLCQSADLAVAAGGMSSWERCALGLPSVTVSVADNQLHVCQSLATHGAAVHLPGTPRPSAAVLRSVCKALLKDPEERARMAKAAVKLCDGKGTERVLDVLEADLRPLTPQDKDLLFDWRDQPHIRAASLNQAPLDPATHATWFANALSREDALLRIYREGGKDLGFVGATGGETGWSWSFYIGAKNAPKGAGRRMLVSFLDLFFEIQQGDHIHAVVLDTNAASLHLHRSLGFTEMPATATSEHNFRLSRQTWERSKSP